MIDPFRTDSSDWQLSNNHLTYRTSVFEIDLYPVRQTDFIIEAPSELAPARYILYEWTDYRLRVESPTSKQVRLGSVYQRPDFDKIFTLRYENQLGRSQIRIELDQDQLCSGSREWMPAASRNRPSISKNTDIPKQGRPGASPGGLAGYPCDGC